MATMSRAEGLNLTPDDHHDHGTRRHVAEAAGLAITLAFAIYVAVAHPEFAHGVLNFFQTIGNDAKALGNDLQNIHPFGPDSSHGA